MNETTEMRTLRLQIIEESKNIFFVGKWMKKFVKFLEDYPNLSQVEENARLAELTH